MRIDQLVVALAGLATAAVGGWASLQEANPFLNSGLDGAGQLKNLVNGSLVPGLSSDAARAYAETCMDVVPRLDARFLPSDQAELLLEACETRIGVLAENSPVNSFLWLAHAQLAYNAADWSELNQSLVMSRTSGPYEYWLAARRLGLFERSLAHLEPETVRQFDQEIMMLAQSPQGSRLLAAQYIMAPDLRPKVTSLIDTLSEPVQGEFLENVRIFVVQRNGKL